MEASARVQLASGSGRADPLLNEPSRTLAEAETGRKEALAALSRERRKTEDLQRRIDELAAESHRARSAEAALVEERRSTNRLREQLKEAVSESALAAQASQESAANRAAVAKLAEMAEAEGRMIAALHARLREVDAECKDMSDFTERVATLTVKAGQSAEDPHITF